MRKVGSSRGAVSAYPRQLESLIRLAEAHAKMRFSFVVETVDVEEAKRCGARWAPGGWFAFPVCGLGPGRYPCARFLCDHRLHREALKQAATDPKTGIIDIGILTTGVRFAPGLQQRLRVRLSNTSHADQQF